MPTLVVLAAGLACSVGCANDIGLPQPAELRVAQVGYGARGTIELSWELVVRAERYLIGYDSDSAAPPYEGTGLSLKSFPERCGDFDAGSATRSKSAGDGGAEGGVVGDGAPDGAASGDGASGDGAVGDGASGDGGSGDGASGDATKDSQLARDVVRPDVLGPGLDVNSPIVIPAEWCLDTEDTFTDAGVVPVRTPGKQPRVRLQNLEVGKTYFFAVKAARRSSESAFSAAVELTVRATK